MPPAPATIPPPRPRPTPLRAILALILRDMATRYGRSPGGYIWAFALPIGGLVVLTLGFSLFVRTPPLGNSFAVFFASGLLPFSIYASVQGAVQTALQYSRPLLMYPAVSWIDAILARFLLEALTGIVVLVLVLAAILFAADGTPVLRVGPMIGAVALLALLGLGLGALNCLLVGLYPAWGNLWQIATRPLFLMAGVIFIFEDLPRVVQDLLWVTPWIHAIGLFRTGVYPTYQPDYISVPLVMGWALVPLALGLLLLRRHHQTILMD